MERRSKFEGVVARDCTPSLNNAAQVLLGIVCDALDVCQPQASAALRLGTPATVRLRVLETDLDFYVESPFVDSGVPIDDLAVGTVPVRADATLELEDSTLQLGRLNRDQLANLHAVAKQLGWQLAFG